ncbi:stimulator of interferon genes protein homolog isoform X2 [Cataglyphis hispanica]|uniref:stimulator of interferon genes protein homolog isoform X2 n=1 Tax=Cataglyphis hispanica TaxID=1086592 RepID=UPI0021808029|nr:stimulator of interferon genes protein homolog isoform X2 [Cataglyphis hispanica]
MQSVQLFLEVLSRHDFSAPAPIHRINSNLRVPYNWRQSINKERSARMESERYLSTDRKWESYLTHSVILVVIFVIPVACKAKKDGVITSLIATCLVTSVFLVIFLFCDLILRLCQTLISLTNMDQQHGRSFSSIVSHYFALNTASAAVFVIGVFLFLIASTMIVRGCPLHHVWDFGPYFCVPLIMFSFYLLRITDLAEWERFFDLGSMKGLDYGTGMAYSFYYGYLRLILPNRGTTDSKSIIEKIENFEDKHGVTFPVHKLFILISSSGYMPPNLKEVSDQWMENAHELEEEKRDRAGTIGRTYRNNAYKIYPNGRNSGASPVYVVVEGATPLLTFYEVQKHSHPESPIYKQYKNDITMMFYKKLREILQNEPNTRNMCELIYYDDYDLEGAKVNIAKKECESNE